MVAAIGLRPALADHSRETLAVLSRVADGTRHVVEIGGFEGGGSAGLRRTMDPGGVLVVVDPYRTGRLGFSAPFIVAKRQARRDRNIDTRFVRLTSLDAAATWKGPVDLLVLDGLHSRDGVVEDWQAWERFVNPEGRIVARNDVVLDRHASPLERASTLVDEASPGRWTVLEVVDDLSVFGRV